MAAISIIDHLDGLSFRFVLSLILNVLKTFLMLKKNTQEDYENVWTV